MLFLGTSVLCLFTRTHAQPHPAAIDKPIPIVNINLVSFDPAIGDVFARLAITWPQHLLKLNADESLKTSDKLVGQLRIDDSILQINAGSAFSSLIPYCWVSRSHPTSLDQDAEQ